MRTQPIHLTAFLALLASSAGCGQLTNWKDSGIPEALGNHALLFEAGAPHELELPGAAGGSGRRPYAVEVERHFQATISAGTAGQLLAAFRTKVRNQIESLGGNIQGMGVSGDGGAEVSAFSYDYNWRGNAGLVRVHSFVGSDERVEIILFCYEHRR